MSVFVDTSGLFALLVRTEERHADVVSALRKVLQEGRVLHTTSYVIVGTVALSSTNEPIRSPSEGVGRCGI